MAVKDKEWIDNAGYYQLLERWRFGSSDDFIFHGESGEYYAKVMKSLKDKLSRSGQVLISKGVGWEKPI